jgi:histidine ammonia-lyase
LTLRRRYPTSWSMPSSTDRLATFAARRLGDIADNVANILAIELLAAAQGVDLRGPVLTSPVLQLVMREIAARVRSRHLRDA